MPLEAPKGYHYEVSEFKINVVAFWLCGGPTYIYKGGESPRTIHSFYNYKKNVWYSPINAKKVGTEVNPRNMRPWSAMPLNLNPLMAAFV